MGHEATVDLDTHFASNCSAFGLAVNNTVLESGVGHANTALALTTGLLLLSSH